MAVGTNFADFLLDELAPLGDVRVRRMFGGAGVYCGGLMFGLVARHTLYFRVDEVNRPAFQAEACEPFSYEGRGRSVQLPYWRVPARLFEDQAEMVEWARAALLAAQRAAGKRHLRATPRRRGKRGLTGAG